MRTIVTESSSTRAPGTGAPTSSITRPEREAKVGGGSERSSPLRHCPARTTSYSSAGSRRGAVATRWTVPSGTRRSNFPSAGICALFIQEVPASSERQVNPARGWGWPVSDATIRPLNLPPLSLRVIATSPFPAMTDASAPG